MAAYLLTPRRYYLAAARNMALEESDLVYSLLSKRDAAALTPLPPGFPFAAKLGEARDETLEDWRDTVRIYAGIEDLRGADAEELEDVAGLEPEEAERVLAFLETL